MRYLSICSGIEAATVAWHPLGWEALAFSEIEPFPCAVLAHHYPDVPNHGDFTQADWRKYRGAVDLAVAGTPCQDFSVAGLRAGMAGTRGNLTLEFLRVLDEARPRWMVWENVPGVLSVDGGRAFGAFLGGLAQLGYGFAYRVLDAQYFGVAQRRRRVFVVGYLGDWRAAAAVLFEREGLRGDTPPSREAGQGAAGTLESRPTGGGFPGTDGACAGHVVADTLTANFHKHHGASGGKDSLPRNHVCITGPVTHSLRAEGFDASEDGTGRGQPMVACFGGNNTSGPIDVATARSASGSASGRLDFESETFAVSTKLHNTSSNQSGKIYEEYTVGLDVNSPPPALLTATQVRRLTTRECERLQGFPDDYTNIPWKLYQECERKGWSYEAELVKRGLRLHGCTADYCPDGPRYKALGNSKAVPVVRWIGKRIEAVEEILRRKA